MLNDKTYGLIDDLSVEYDGNQRVSVEDESDASLTYAGAFDFEDGASSEQEYTYDVFGNVLTETDKTNPSHPLTTTYTYDGGGRCTSSTSPEGIQTRNEMGWEDNSDEWEYFTRVLTNGQAPVTTRYDKRGQELFSQTVGPKGVYVTKATTYNQKGQVIHIESKTGTLITTQDFTYDERGRVTNDSSSIGKSVHYEYGNRMITKKVAGRSYTTTSDAWGNVIKSTDPSGAVEYTYGSNGLPRSVKAHGTVVTMEYDAAGNQTKLVDPDAGTMTYTYAADGSLLTQMDARGVKTTNIYDDLGRLKKVRIGDKEISYTYGNVGNETMRLTSQSMDKNTIAYDYDPFGRVKKETRTLADGTTLSFEYDYDSLGQLSRTIYPGDLEVIHQYDSCGFKTRTLANGKEIYHQVSFDGLVSTDSLLSSLLLTRTRNNNGYETSRKISYGTTILEQFQTTYDIETGNLLSRHRWGTPKESFTYDNMDRLIAVKEGKTRTMSMEYAPNGNILSKTGTGDYKYDSKKPHAVTWIEFPGSSLDTSFLQTEFNELGKIQHIEQDAPHLKADFQYGPDGQRWSSTLLDCTNIQVIIRKSVYAGNYEKVTTPPDGEGFPKKRAIAREFYYLDGGVIMVKQDGKFTPYLAFTDNLGSILSIMDENGEPVFNASYDAWGKQTVTLNTIGFQRGYTGHEMLNEFGIINMNGRLYDPELGRFFSPDNYVQAPTNSQNFNRYSYCLNNPLKYNDPSGNFWEMIVASTVMCAMQYGAQEDMNGGNFWNGAWKGALIGAASSAAGMYIGGVISSTMSSATGFWVGFAGGATGGATAGFIAGAGRSWLNGSSFTKGLIKGSFNAAIGGTIGGLMGGIDSGLEAKSQGDNFWKGSSGYEIKGSYVDTNKDIELEDGMRYDNDFSASFSEKRFGSDYGPNSKYVRHLNSDGTLPQDANGNPIKGYETDAKGYVWNVKNPKNKYVIQGYCQKLKGYGSKSDIYLFKSAFINEKELYLTMGHEYMHAFYNAQGLHMYVDQQHAAIYKWMNEQAASWNYHPDYFEEMSRLYPKFNPRYKYPFPIIK